MAESKGDTKGLTVKKSEDMPGWYSQVCKKAGLADHAPIKGCMVIRPNGYAIWEAIQKKFDAMIKAHGVRNAYFPLFIPESFFEKEKEHAEGFEPEVAWLERKNEHEERYALRPTSEAIINDSYSTWVRSWRDLPLLINQWCNIVRWEVQDCKLFLRTREFLWQEGHCVYETEEECHKETMYYLELYRQVAEELLAVPVMTGRKSEREKFAGAKATYGIEGFMPDGKALQMGTSHDLGQNFAKAFGISFQGRDEKPQSPWTNSWGISTRMIGAVIMTHGDDKGLVLPPRAAEHKCVIIPIIFKEDKKVVEAARTLKEELEGFNPILDDRDEYSAGWKFNKYELEGIPIRVEIGPKDLAQGQVVLVRRDTGEKTIVQRASAAKKIEELLEQMHKEMFTKAKKLTATMIVEPKDYAEFKKNIEQRKMNFCGHCGDADCEGLIKEETAATTRVVPLDKKLADAEGKKCIKCGKPAKYRVYFSRAY